MVFYCERAAGSAATFAMMMRILRCTGASCRADPQVRQRTIDRPPGRPCLRLDRVRTISHKFGYGVGDDMDSFSRSTRGVQLMVLESGVACVPELRRLAENTPSIGSLALVFASNFSGIHSDLRDDVLSDATASTCTAIRCFSYPQVARFTLPITSARLSSLLINRFAPI